MGEAFLRLKLKDQAKSLQLLAADPQLSQLSQLKVRSPAGAIRLDKPRTSPMLHLLGARGEH